MLTKAALMDFTVEKDGAIAVREELTK